MKVHEKKNNSIEFIDLNFNYLLCVCPGVGGNGLTLSGGHRRVTNTVAGNGIDVPFNPALPYGAGNCLYAEKRLKKKMRKNA